jgi:O-antigen/teichoic acid export membrane protein
MTENLKNKAFNGVLWSAAERFSLQGVQFVFNIIIARLLLPSDFGIIAMLAVFLQISQAFIDSGFTNALIQKQNRTEQDFSTVFYFNIFISIVFYIVLYFSAPFIAVFYNIPLLIPITRFISISLVINSLSAIHKVKLSILIDFRSQAKVAFVSAFLSGGIGVFFAYLGYGVWSLVIQTIASALFITAYMWVILRWKPALVFSFRSFKVLFSFGSKLLLSGLISTVYRNLYPLLIGKKFSAFELGVFSNADLFSKILSSNLSSIMSRVMFPVLVTVQNDNERLVSIYRRYIRLTSFIIFPSMIWMVAMANPIVSFLLTEKWIEVVVLLQILCFDWMFDHLSVINLNLLLVKGRSDLSLKLEIIKKSFAVTILFISLYWGIEGVCYGRVLYSLIATVLNTHYTKTLIDLSFFEQLKDVYPYFFMSIIMGFGVYLLNFVECLAVLKLLLGLGIGALIYFSFSIVLYKSDIYDFLALIKRK